MDRRRKPVVGVLVACLCAAWSAFLVAGCGTVKTKTSTNAVKPSNDIVTMGEVDPGKMTITLRAEYNVNNAAILAALKEKFPDVEFVSVLHCGQDTGYELRQSLGGGSAEDIIISPEMKAVSDIASKDLLDLTSADFTGNYVSDALTNGQTGGKTYYLPGPSSVYGIVCDKTLFDANGWQVPQSYDEFTALCQTIEATGIRAFQPACGDVRQAQMVLAMFDYANVFGGQGNRQWQMNYQTGNASMKGHLEPALTRFQELQSAGIIKSSDFDVQASDLASLFYTSHGCAMIIGNEQTAGLAREAGSDHAYAMMPFRCGNDADSDYLVSIPSYYVGVSARLAETGNEAKRDKVMEVLRYISTPEGQLAMSGGSLTQISNVKGTEYAKSDFNAGVQDTIQKGRAVSEVDLMASGTGNGAEKKLVSGLGKLLDGTADQETLMADCDAARDSALKNGVDRGERVGTASSSFTPLETGLFIADALKIKASADIGLCLVGTTRCGMVGRLYKGEIYAADVGALSLSVGTANGRSNDNRLWRVAMNGAQLKALLKQALEYNPGDGVPDIPYYVASGLKIEVAPWNADKLVKVTLADGSPLDDGKTYHVALWGWPFSTDCPGILEKVYNDSSDAILTEAIRRTGTVSPITDGRFKVTY